MTSITPVGRPRHCPHVQSRPRSEALSQDARLPQQPKAARAQPGELFQAIKQEKQDKVVTSCLAHLKRMNIEEFKLSLHEIGNAFGVLRHSYERAGCVLDVQLVLSLTGALHDLANR